MGVMSRRVLPACGSLCCFCPSLRARSRQPVKRYKKLIADTFPRSQDGQPNERMIGKLCDYTSKNPMRIPKKMNRKLVHISVWVGIHAFLASLQICVVLYLGDSTKNGKILRLKQQFFLCSASLQACYIARQHKSKFVCTWSVAPYELYSYDDADSVVL